MVLKRRLDTCLQALLAPIRERRAAFASRPAFVMDVVRAGTERAAALTHHLSLGWQHAFGDVSSNANLAFVGGGSAFSVSGVPIARDSALIGAGVEYAFSKTVSASLSYNGQFASGTEHNAFKGAISIEF